MSLLAMSLGFRFCVSRKDGRGEVGRFQRWAQMAWLLLDLAVETQLVRLGGPFLSSFAQMGLENSPLAM